MIIVLTTTATKKDAERIADLLLEKKMAACVQILPITSKYRWKGGIESAGEFLCLIKTKDYMYGKVEKAIKEIHKYENPEIAAIHVSKVSQDYLAWLNSEVKT